MESYRSWASKVIPEGEQFGFWQETVDAVLGPMEVERDGDGSFPARVVQTSVGALTLSSVRAAPHRSRRTETTAAHNGGGMVYVEIPRAGQLSGRQRTHETATPFGILGMLVDSQPVTLVAGADFRQLVIGVPAELIVPRLAAPVGIALSMGGLCGLVAHTTQYVFDHAADFNRADGQRVAAHLTSLIVSAFGSLPGLTPHELILQSAMDEAERCLADRALTPAVLAERVHVSRRTLEKLFAERGITVARWLQERRLERSRDELLSTSAEDATIEVIAERCGFADRTHFSRVFHARFGVAPGQLRRGTSAAKR